MTLAFLLYILGEHFRLSLPTPFFYRGLTQSPLGTATTVWPIVRAPDDR
jgi:hypothetical protein